MKTSNSLLAGLLMVILVGSNAWAQDEAETQGEAQASEAVESAQEAQPEEAAEDEAPQDEASEAGVPEEEAADDAAEESVEEASDGSAEETADEQSDSSEGTAESTEVSEEENSAETFVFQGHPIFTPEQAERVYSPLVDYLNQALPYRFELAIAPDYHRYWLGIRRGDNPHLVLEEPHLVSFRMDRYDYQPLVRAEEPITYSLLTTMMAEGEIGLDDFIGRPVSSMPAPSLGYLVLADWFDNPMQQPVIQSNASSWLDAVEIVFSMEADAAVVPHNLVSRYVNMLNVRTSQEFPGVTIAASPEVPQDIQEEIRQALLGLHENEEHFAALHELDVDRFTASEPANYEGLDEWLSLVYSIF